MILFSQLIGWGLSAALGIVSLRRLRQDPGPMWTLFTIVVGPGLGFGISSLIWFLVWCSRSSGSPLVPLAVEFALLLMLSRWRPPEAISHRQLTAWRGTWPLLLIALSLGCAVFHFQHFLRAAPYAGWDAWAIWNLHARALFTGGGRIWKTELFKIPWTHPDYPLLLPLNVTRLWFLAGSETLAAPALLSAYFTFATAGVLAIALNQVKGSWCAASGVATLLASNQFLWVGLQEIADLPLAFYILTASAFLLLAKALDDPKLLIAAGFAGGLGAWTKNEGLTFLLCLLIAHLLLERRWPHTARIALGACLPLAVTILFKRRVPSHSDVLGWLLTREGWIRAMDSERLWPVIRHCADRLWKLDTWLISSVAVLAIYFVLIGWERRPARHAQLRQVAGVVYAAQALLLLIYLAVYATSPGNADTVNRYVDSSIDRLYIQLWPAFVLFFFVLTRLPFSGIAQSVPVHGSQVDTKDFCRERSSL